MNSQFDIVEREKIFKWSVETLWGQDGLAGREYLIDKRKISEDTAKLFQLGYVPHNANNILAGRIIFPIFDTSDHLIAIGSRAIEAKNSSLPVYWHETYKKSFYLFGMNLTKNHIRQRKHVVVCEGNFDVIKCYDEGLTNIVGLMGTSISNFQIALLLRYCEEAVFIFDNDENKAGEKASVRTKKKFEQYVGTESALMYTYYIKLEGSKDPDEYVRNYGISSLKKLIKDELNKESLQNA